MTSNDLQHKHHSFAKLELLSDYTDNLLIYNSKVKRIISLSLAQLDYRRQIVVECIIKEIQCNMGIITNYIFSNVSYSDSKFDIVQFLNTCFKPIEGVDECYLQRVFVDLFFANSSKTIMDINDFFNKPDVERHHKINKFFSLLKTLVEEIFIVLQSINVKCTLYNPPCTCSKTNFCCCEDREDELILYYSNCYDDLASMIKKYVKIGKRYFQKNKIKLIVDFNYISSNNSIDITDKDYIELKIAQKFFKSVELRNTRIDKIVVNQTLRESIFEGVMHANS